MPSMSGVEFTNANKKPNHQKDRVCCVIPSRAKCRSLRLAMIVLPADSSIVAFCRTVIAAATKAKHRAMDTVMAAGQTMAMTSSSS
jgi:hypothetical protein